MTFANAMGTIGAPLDAEVWQKIESEELLGGPEERARILDLYIDKLGENLAGLEEAAARDDTLSFGMLSHASKSSSAMFGAYQLAELFEVMESAAASTSFAKDAGALLSAARREFRRVRQALIAGMQTG